MYLVGIDLGTTNSLVAVMDQGRVEQVATPVELYKTPGNPFVADFIGTSNLHPGVVTADGVAALAMAEAATQSAKSGQPVALASVIE